MSIFFVHIDYDESKAFESYEGVYITDDKNVEIIRENSGNPVVDWSNIEKKFLEMNTKNDKILYTSSVDQFVMDTEVFKFDENDHLVRI